MNSVHGPKPKRTLTGGYASLPNRWIDAGYSAVAPVLVQRVYLYMVRWADNRTGIVRQPIARMARLYGSNENRIREATRILEAWGCIERLPAEHHNSVPEWQLLDLPRKAPEYPRAGHGSRSGHTDSHTGHTEMSKTPTAPGGTVSVGIQGGGDSFGRDSIRLKVSNLTEYQPHGITLNGVADATPERESREPLQAAEVEPDKVQADRERVADATRDALNHIGARPLTVSQRGRILKGVPVAVALKDHQLAALQETEVPR